MANNDLAPTTISETEANLRAELAAERAARQTVERMAGGRPAQPPPAPEPDALKQFEEKTQLQPEQVDLLRRGIDQVIRQRVGPAFQQFRSEVQREAFAKTYEDAVNFAMQANPDINPEKFAAASAAAQLAIKQSGRDVLPGEFVRESVKKYRELFPTAAQKDASKAPPPDFVEGASSPAHAATLGAPPVEEKPKEPSRLQKQYGDDENDIIDLENVADPAKLLEEMTQSYALEKNGYLEDKGMRTFMPAVARPLQKRRKAKKAAAAAAGAR